jgi:hypothetical protein
MNDLTTRLERFRQYVPAAPDGAAAGLAALVVTSEATSGSSDRSRFRAIAAAVGVSALGLTVGALFVASDKARHNAPTGSTPSVSADSVPTFGVTMSIRIVRPESGEGVDAQTTQTTIDAFKERASALGVQGLEVTPNQTGGFVVRLPGARPSRLGELTAPPSAVPGIVFTQTAPTESYGTPPPLQGKPVTNAPKLFRIYPPSDLDRASVRHVLTTDKAHGAWSLFAAVSVGGDTFLLERPGSEPWDTGICDVGLGQLAPCDFSGRDYLGKVTFTGRVGDRVTTVEGHYPSGPPEPATVANGWFVFVGDSKRGVPDDIVALDAQGALIGRIADIPVNLP